MIKHCVVCGAPFDAPPSSKKITCSKECSSERKKQSHIDVHNTWSADARARRSKQFSGMGYTEIARRGLEAAMARPDSQRGPGHREAKRWILIAPDGERYEVVNLKDWARHHAHWFDDVTDEADRERIADNIRSGFAGIVQSMLGHKKHPCFTYKGWRLGDWPRAKRV